jgi:hypothetical protein
VIIYLDDILIYSKIEEEYKKHVKKIFKKLINKNLRIKIKKLKFYTKEINFLGFIIGQKKVKIDKKNTNNTRIANAKNN